MDMRDYRIGRTDIRRRDDLKSLIIQGVKVEILESAYIPDSIFFIYLDKKPLTLVVSPLNKLLIDVYLSPDVFARIEAQCAYESFRIDKKFHL